MAKRTAKTTAKKVTTTSATTVKKSAAKSALTRSTTRNSVTGRYTRIRTRSETGISERRHSAAGTRIEHAVDRYRELLESADRTGRARLIDAVTTYTDRTAEPELDESLWGLAPTEAQVRAAQLAQLRSRFEDRRALAAHSLTRNAAAELLNITAQAVTDHLQHGDLTGLKDGKQWLLPVWQFDADCERGFLPGIAAVAAAFPGGVVSLSRWVTRPSPEFDDRTPRDEMASGAVDEVTAVAAALTSAGW